MPNLQFSMDMTISTAKKAAGYAAAELVNEGMLVGLGSGSTVAFFLERLAERCTAGLRILCAASSTHTQQQALSLQIPLADINHLQRLDVTVDGADEITPSKLMIKGGGGALLREKILAAMSDEMIVIVDQSKLVDRLGRFPLAVEIVPFGWLATIRHLQERGFNGQLRCSLPQRPYITDNENFIYDIAFPAPLDDPEAIEQQLVAIPGVLQTGLFFRLAGRVIIGKADGTVEIRT
jgi:ribose 5-phosphate isomerase A